MSRAPAFLLLAGALLSGASWWLAPGAAPLGWLAALFALLGWPLGSMALLLVHALTGGRWGDAIRQPLLIGAMLLPLALLAAIPVGLTLGGLYPWIGARASNAWYLNLPFLALRAGIDAVVWLGLAALTILGALGRGPALARIAPAGLILLALTVTFAAIDLTASLDPSFNSSVYGMLSAAGMALFALAVAVLLGPRGEARDDLAKLLLALSLLWTYLDFAQFLVVWSSNLASDAPWFALRLRGVWAWSLGAAWLVHSFGAVLLLGVPRLRRMETVLMGFAAAVAVLGLARGWWLVLPGRRGAPGWADAGCMAGLFAIAAGATLLLARTPALAARPAHA